MQTKNPEEMYWTEYERNEHEADRQAETESQLGADEQRVHMNFYDTNYNQDEQTNSDDDLKLPILPIKYLIIDCSPIYFIDTVGCKTIKQVLLLNYQLEFNFFKMINICLILIIKLVNDFNEIGIVVYLTDCNGIIN